MGHPRSFPFSVLACALLSLTFYRIWIGTWGLSNSLSPPETIPINSYQAEFFPKDTKTERKNLIDSYPRSPPLLANVRTIDESELPYQCGIIFFYHIACTGGSSINRWLGKEKDNNEGVTYWTRWGRHDGVEPQFIAGVNEQIQNLGSDEWRIIHAHGYSFFPNTSEPYLYKWRDEVESQGCKLIVTTMLRDAVGHTISQSKGMINPNLTLDEWIVHLEPENKNQRGIFNTQLDYMVYNRGPRNEFNATKEEKARRGIELLQRHFDVVLLSDYEKFVNIIVKITGWKKIDMRRANTFNGELNFTERELDKIRRLTVENGDVAFIDAVRHIYYGYLDYLLD